MWFQIRSLFGFLRAADRIIDGIICFLLVLNDKEHRNRYRRRNNEEKPKLANYAKGDLAKDLFPILDNFKLGLDAAEKQHPEAKSITEGFAMIATQLKNALAQHRIEEINPIGKMFDPNEHESLTSQPSEDVPEDHVLFVHRVGYKIGDRLLRPASVVISAGKGA